jgi:hypothetical protein
MMIFFETFSIEERPVSAPRPSPFRHAVGPETWRNIDSR